MNNESVTSPPPIDARAAMWDMIIAYRKSQIVHAAARLSLAEHCAAGTVTAELLAEAEGADPQTVARFLRACAASGLVTCKDDRYYSGTPLLDVLRRNTEGSQWGFAMSLPAPGHWLPWGRLTEAIKEGTTQADSVLGGHVFSYYEQHPDEAAAFMAGLSGMTAVAGAEAARVIDMKGADLAVDVGGATGTLLHDLMAANPELRGIVFDVPDVVPQAEEVARQQGLQDRISVVGGDFFESVPAGADAYLLRYVLHDWNDEKGIQILKNCRTAMAPAARLFVLEMILGTVGQEDEVVPSQDLNMLAILYGRERTIAEFDVLLDAAGLRRVAVHETDSPMAVIVAEAA